MCERRPGLDLKQGPNQRHALDGQVGQIIGTYFGINTS